MEGQRGVYPAQDPSSLPAAPRLPLHPLVGGRAGQGMTDRSLRTPGSIVASQFSEKNVGPQKLIRQPEKAAPQLQKLDCKSCASIMGYWASGVRGYENPLCSLNLKDSRNSPPPSSTSSCLHLQIQGLQASTTMPDLGSTRE